MTYESLWDCITPFEKIRWGILVISREIIPLCITPHEPIPGKNIFFIYKKLLMLSGRYSLTP